MTAVHRLKQGVRALLAFTQTVDYDLAAQYLTEAQLDLFKQLGHVEQLHSLNVLRDVIKQEEPAPHDLALAALLHDVGKLRYNLAIWQKTLSVLVKRFLPALAREWSRDQRLTFWRAPFVVRRYHADWSGELVAATGVSERALWLITHHQDRPEQWREHPYYPLLIRLQSADDAN